MENSLSQQSRKLIEKLSSRKDNKQNIIRKLNDNLLNNSDNLRQKKPEENQNNHSLTESYPKSSVTSILGRSAFLRRIEDLSSNISTITVLSNDEPKRLPFGMTNSLNERNNGEFDERMMRNSDLLGYDWIAGMMENTRSNGESQLDKPLEFFEELDKFRRANKHYCISSDNRHQSDQSFSFTNTEDYKKVLDKFNYGIQFTSQDNPHKIVDDEPHVYAYTLNERLFPVPLDYETAERGVPDSNNPHIIKVSIPSNRFLNRNHKLITLKDKKPHPSEPQNIGESLSLFSHCQSSAKFSMPVSQPDKLSRQINSIRQEPAGLIGNLVTQNPNLTEKLNDNLTSFCKNQPKTEQEAIDQLKRGKTGAKLSRLVPSSLENRSFNLESLPVSANICQTRIALKDLQDDSNPREWNPISCESNRTQSPLETYKNLSYDVPRPSVSRKEMSRVYVDAIESIRDDLKSS